MIRSKRVNAYSDNAVLSEYYGLSTDTKPTENVATGSVFTEVDTGATFLYDEESEDWSEVENGSSGGGGGGDSDFSTAVVTLKGFNGSDDLITIIEEDIMTAIPLADDEAEMTVIVPLYKGNYYFFTSAYNVSGNAEVNGEMHAIRIYGDCTITRSL